ncbi:MAG: glycosyltransferase [Candidatus Homeothermus sp.]|nr:glycosyltransferase [Candidatus Homeothermus sp.]
MKILTIIVTFNGMEWIDRCLSSVQESSLHSDIMIVDNGSTDGTVEHVQSTFNGIEIIASKENLGFGKANNIGLLKAVNNQYDYVYLLNQDAWIEKETLEKLVDIHQRNPAYGILSPLQTDATKKSLDRNFVLACNDYMLSDACCGNLKEFYPTEIVMAAHWLISKDCLAKTGGFSPTFPHYGEDNNYAQRAAFHGFKIGIVTTTKGVHDRSERVMTKAKSRYLHYINGLIMLSCPRNRRGLLFLTFDYIKYFLKQPSFDYVKYYFRTLCNLREINHNRIISLQSHAFLH